MPHRHPRRSSPSRARLVLLVTGLALAQPAAAATVRQHSTYLCNTAGMFRRAGVMLGPERSNKFHDGDRPMGNAAASLPRFSLAEGEGVFVAAAIVGASGRIYATGPIHYVDASQTFVMNAAGTFDPIDPSAIAVELPHHVQSVTEPTSAYAFYRSTRGGAVAYAVAVVPGHELVCETAGSAAPAIVQPAARRLPPRPPPAAVRTFESELPAP